MIFDFAQPADHVSSVQANGQAVAIRSENGHLIIPAESLARGENTVDIAFTAGDEALNRNDEYLYSLFVPARASRAFPCFDQPDIKGTLSLTLEVPAAWAALSNAPETGRETSGDRATVRFGETPALPTYLFGFAAGKFSVERGERNGRTFQLYHRETDAAKVAANLETIFDLHHQALGWLEAYTDRKYPFAKLDFVLLPAFQFSGMEHAGAIYYNAPAVFLDKTATQNQLLSRASLIAHETSHMWFGDLVTMKWFDDVWLKEVFANFMAAKIVNPTFPEIDHELRFFLQHYPPAYEVDRTAGANPIRQELANLREAGSLYGPIIYQKAPIVMRQLEQILGAEALRDGLREYLTRFAFSNATWIDLIEILDRRTDEDLAAWSRVWVSEPGRPTIATNLQTEGGKNLAPLVLTVGSARQAVAVEPAASGCARLRGWRAAHRAENERADGRNAARERLPGSELHPSEWRRQRLRVVQDRRGEQAVLSRSHVGNRRRPDAGHRVGHAVGRHARGRHPAAADLRPRPAHAAE